jgi:hypothetical protein
MNNKIKGNNGFGFTKSFACCHNASVNILHIKDKLTKSNAAIIHHINNQIKIFANSCRQFKFDGSLNSLFGLNIIIKLKN